MQAAGVLDGDVMELIRKTQRVNQGARGQAETPQATMERLRGDAVQMQLIQQQNPGLATMIRNGDVAGFERAMAENQAAQEAARAAKQHEIDLMNADPFDPEAQVHILVLGVKTYLACFS